MPIFNGVYMVKKRFLQISVMLALRSTAGRRCYLANCSFVFSDGEAERTDLSAECMVF